MNSSLSWVNIETPAGIGTCMGRGVWELEIAAEAWISDISYSLYGIDNLSLGLVVPKDVFVPRGVGISVTLPPSAILTRQNVVDYVKRRLGSPQVRIELSDEHVNDALDDALRSFNRYLIVFNFKSYAAYDLVTTPDDPDVVPLNVGTFSVDLPTTAIHVYEVRVLRPQDYRESLQMNVFEIVYRMMQPNIPLGQWYQLRSFFKMWQRVRGTDPDWKFDAENRKLYVDCRSGPYDIGVVFSAELTIETIITGSRKRWAQDFLDLAVAHMKLRLAEFRGKFGNSIPAPGGSVSTNADVLLSTANEAIKEIGGKLQRGAAARLLPQMG